MHATAVDVTFSLVLGSSIVPEDKLPTPLALDAEREGVDGALVLQVGEETLLDERYWDRLDECLVGLLQGLVAVQEEQHATVVFPDTRLEIEMTPLPQGHVKLIIEHREFTIPIAPVMQGLRQCSRRLLGHLPQEHWSAMTRTLNELTLTAKEGAHA